jgi:hypothetical protein
MPTLADFPDAVMIVPDNLPLRKVNPLTWRLPFSDRLRFAEMVLSRDPRFRHPACPDLVTQRVDFRFDGPFDPEQPESSPVLATVFFVPENIAHDVAEATR